MTTYGAENRPAAAGQAAAGQAAVRAALALGTWGIVVAAGAGFAGVYSTGQWFGPFALTAAAVVVGAHAARRLRLPLPAVLLCAAVAGWWAASAMVAPGALRAGLPLGRSFNRLSWLWAQASHQFAGSVAPVPATPGFVLWTALGAGLVALATDWFATSGHAAGSLGPPVALFAIACALGTGAQRAWAVPLFVFAAAAFLALQQSLATGRGGRLSPSAAPYPLPVPPGGASGTAPTTPVTRRSYGYARGLAFGALAALVALAVVPLLGRDGTGPVGWRAHGPQGVRLTPSPLVSMQADLIERTRTPAFRVRSSAASYWRLTSLDNFNGTSWEASGSYSSVQGRLPGVSTRPGARQVRESFQIQALGSPWLPVAFQPESVSTTTGVSYDPASDSLLTATPTADGQRYEVTASQQLAMLSPAALASVPPLDAADTTSMKRYLQLPALPPTVAALAHDLTGTGANEYAKALALQDYFHRPPYTYTLEPPPGPSPSALVNFLFYTHAGYCQQYAGAFAVLARAAGIPARVAVGFATGTEVAPHLWQVVDGDAHAWPEVWFPTLGWAPFEPTPSFAIPAATQYTGQGSGAGAQPSQATPAPGSPYAGSAPAAAGQRYPAAAHRANTSAPLLAHHGASAVTGPARSGPSPWWLSMLAAIPAGLLAFNRAGRHRRHRRRLGHLGLKGGPAGEGHPAAAPLALLCWAELGDELAAFGLGAMPAESPSEFADRAGRALDAAARPLSVSFQLEQLAELVNAAAYGPGDIADAELARARAWASQIRHLARMVTPLHRRLAGALDPRTGWTDPR